MIGAGAWDSMEGGFSIEKSRGEKEASKDGLIVEMTASSENARCRCSSPEGSIERGLTGAVEAVVESTDNSSS